MKYMFIEEYSSEHSVNLLCRVLGASRSGYYAWLQRPISARERANRELLVHIRRSHRESRETYGSPRVFEDLRGLGIRCGKNRVAVQMRRHGIASKIKKRFKVTTRSQIGASFEPDRLQRDFTADRPNQVWTADITYILTREGWLFLAVLLDLCTRAVVGWATSERIDADLVCTALKHALGRRALAETLILHSDRGSQFTSKALRRLISQYNGLIVQSHGISCYDNAVSESFFHTLKAEHTNHEEYATRAEAHSSIFDYIELFYNRKRRHSTLGYQTPWEIESMRKNP